MLLRAAFDALDTSSADGLLSRGEVAVLATTGPTPPAGLLSSPQNLIAGAMESMPVHPDRLPDLAEFIADYQRQHRQSHTTFTEFVMLCREFSATLREHRRE